MNSTLARSCLLLILIAFAAAQAADNPAPTPRERNKARAAALDAANKAASSGNTNRMVRPGLLADRQQRTVRITAETIRLDLNKPAEFPLISENSGKDYEALAVSFAAPSDVHAALVFIGLTPGKGVDASATRFWPRGDRVRVTLEYETGSGTGGAVTASVSRLVLDTRSGKPLPEEGFVFVGSAWVPPPEWEAGTGLVYAANVFSPNCIVSVYNELTTVLDVPRRSPKHEVYSFLVPNPEARLPDAALATVTLQPWDPVGWQRNVDLTLRAMPPTNAAAGTPDAPAWVLECAGTPPSSGSGFADLTNSLAQRAGAGRDLLLTVEPDNAMTVDMLHRLASLVETIEDQGLVRVEPPPAGHPFYKTFLPEERHRQRAGRPVQPWELYLGHAGGTITGELVYVEEVWHNDNTPSTYNEKRHAVKEPGAIPALLAQHKDAPAVVLIFAAPTLAYGDLRRFMTPFLAANMIVYVFPNP